MQRNPSAIASTQVDCKGPTHRPTPTVSQYLVCDHQSCASLLEVQLGSSIGDDGRACPVAQDVQSQYYSIRASNGFDNSARAAMAYHTSSNDLGHVPEHISLSNVMEPEMVMPNSDEETPGSPSTPGSNRRYTSSGPGPLKRAVSSPNVRSLGGDGAALSAADKKRNKLGYHRTAVACGMFPS